MAKIIQDIVAVIDQPTVVSLQDLKANRDSVVGRYFLTEEVKSHLEIIQGYIEKQQGVGIFLIGHYGAGKSHFLAYLSQTLDQGPKVIPVSLLHYAGDCSLDQILAEQLPGLEHAANRLTAWQNVLKLFPNGILLILDEVSEFLRSKPSPSAFNEDLRTLQLLGELAQEYPLWIVCALQEQIEHTGEMEFDLYRKIKDRFPLRLSLSPVHIRDLLSRKILGKKPDYRPWVENFVEQLARSYPDSKNHFNDLLEIYPIHPATMNLLEEVRACFSQTRGMIAFCLNVLLGKKGHHVFLQEPLGSLVTPDLIVDHFRDLFEVQPEFRSISTMVFAFYEREMPQLFPNEKKQSLARRILNCLILAYISPLRHALQVDELASWLLPKITKSDPKKNLEVIQGVLEVMETRGSFVKRQGGYCLDLEERTGQDLEKLLEREKLQIGSLSAQHLDELLGYLDSDYSLPPEAKSGWATRQTIWHFHARKTYFGAKVDRVQDSQLKLLIGKPWGPQDNAVTFLLKPEPLEQASEILDFYALHRLKTKPLKAQVLEAIQNRLQARKRLFNAAYWQCYVRSQLISPSSEVIPIRLRNTPKNMDALVQHAFEAILETTYPRFVNFAPHAGPIPKTVWKAFLRTILLEGLTSQDPDFLWVVQAYLIPAKLMKRRGTFLEWTNLEKHPWHQAIRGLIDIGPKPQKIYEYLSLPSWGLVEDQIHVFLVALMQTGEIEIEKNSQPFSRLWEKMPFPIQYDSVRLFKGLDIQQQKDLLTLCSGLEIKAPETLTHAALHRLLTKLRQLAQSQYNVLSDVFMELQGSSDQNEGINQLRDHLEVWEHLNRDDDVVPVLGRFLTAVHEPQAFLQQNHSCRNLAHKWKEIKNIEKRFKHIFHYPQFQEAWTQFVAKPLPELSPQNMLQPEAWQRNLTQGFLEYKKTYTKRHDSFWQGFRELDALKQALPKLAFAPSLGTREQALSLVKLQQSLRSKTCRLQCDLDFQPVCSCGFIGHPLWQDEIEHLEQGLAELEGLLTWQFSKGRNREAAQALLKDHPNHASLRSFIEGTLSYPDMEPEVWEKSNRGQPTVAELQLTQFTDQLEGRVWTIEKLTKWLVDSFPKEPFRLKLKNDFWQNQLTQTCLLNGVPLPKGSYGEAPELKLSKNLFENWSNMNFPDGWEASFLKQLFDLKKPVPDSNSEKLKLVQALLHTRFERVEDWMACTKLAYRHHPEMHSIFEGEWVKWLTELENPSFDLPSIADYFKNPPQKIWVLDALSPLFLPRLDWAQIDFCLGPNPSTTQAFYDLIQDLDIQVEKDNRFDRLVHESTQGKILFERAQAEWNILLSQIQQFIKEGGWVCADHGFKLDSLSGKFVHGGNSVLERCIPLIRAV